MIFCCVVTGRQVIRRIDYPWSWVDRCLQSGHWHLAQHLSLWARTGRPTIKEAWCWKDGGSPFTCLHVPTDPLAKSEPPTELRATGRYQHLGKFSTSLWAHNGHPTVSVEFNRPEPKTDVRCAGQTELSLLLRQCRVWRHRLPIRADADKTLSKHRRVRRRLSLVLNT